MLSSTKFLVTKNMSCKYFLEITDTHQIAMWDSSRDMTRAELLRFVKGQSGILCSLWDKIDKEVLDAAGPQLKVVSTMSVSYDHIDVEECRKRGIVVGNTPGILADTVAELTVALLMATLRGLFKAEKALRAKRWSSSGELFFMCGGSVKGSVIGFIGAGRVGSSTMARLKAFKPAQLLYCTRNRVPAIEEEHKAVHCTLTDLLKKSDIVVVCCSLNPSTKHLLDEEQFKLMKSSAILINTSRGAVINQKALIEALKSKEIAGAGLDVFEEEPLPPWNPLLQLKNVVLLPHIGSATFKAREDILKLAIQNLQAGLEGKPLPAAV